MHVAMAMTMAGRHLDTEGEDGLARAPMHAMYTTWRAAPYLDSDDALDISRDGAGGSRPCPRGHGLMARPDAAVGLSPCIGRFVFQIHGRACALAPISLGG